MSLLERAYIFFHIVMVDDFSFLRHACNIRNFPHQQSYRYVEFVIVSWKALSAHNKVT